MSSSQTTSETRSIAPHLALLAVQALFGTWPIAGKIILRSLSPVGLVGFRVLGAGLALGVLSWLLRAKRIAGLRDLFKLALLSLLGVVLNQLFFVKGLELTTAINATLLAATIPVFALIVAVILRRERLTARKIAGIVLAAAGVIYLVNPSQADVSTGALSGDILLLVNSACYGAYIALSKGLVRKYGPFAVITWVFVLGNVVTLPLALWQVPAATIAHLNGLTSACIAYVILFPTIAAYFLNGWALARVDPSVVAVYIYLQPLFAFVLAPLILGERWNSRAWLAMMLIFAGVFIVTRKDSTRSGDAASENVFEEMGAG